MDVIVSVHLDCYNTNTINWVAYVYLFLTIWRQENSRSWHLNIQCLVRACFLIDSCLLLVTSHEGKGEGSLWDLFHKGTNLIHEGSTLMTNHLLKDSPSNTISLGVRMLTLTLKWHKHSIYSSDYLALFFFLIELIIEQFNAVIIWHYFVLQSFIPWRC